MDMDQEEENNRNRTMDYTAYEESEDSDDDDDQGNKEINLIDCYTDKMTFDHQQGEDDEYSRTDVEYK